MAAVTMYSDFGGQEKKICHYFYYHSEPDNSPQMFVPSFSLIETKFASLSWGHGHPDISQHPLQLGSANCLGVDQCHMSVCAMCNPEVVLLKGRCGPIAPLPTAFPLAGLSLVWAILGHEVEGSNWGLRSSKREGVWGFNSAEWLIPRLLHQRDIHCYPVELLFFKKK